jgi:hypothetical protein
MIRLTRRQATLALAALFASTLAPLRSAAAEETFAAPSGRWIDVDLDAHRVTAFDGQTAVRTIPITAGKAGFETPPGTFYVFSRVLEETMTSESFGVPRDAPEGYFVEHVRYIQYFASGGFALHANYWMPDSVFGEENTSHGCVSMREPHAAFLWEFASYDTPVVVHHGAPAVPVSTDVEVPNLLGAAIVDARAKLTALGLTATEHTRTLADVAAGTVLEQEPTGGKVKPGSAVTLTVAEAPKPRVPGPVRPSEGNNAWVPDLVGVLEADARARITQAGLSETYVNYQTEADLPESAREFFRSIPPGCVLSSFPAAGQWLFRGAPVAIAVRKP